MLRQGETDNQEFRRKCARDNLDVLYTALLLLCKSRKSRSVMCKQACSKTTRMGGTKVKQCLVDLSTLGFSFGIPYDVHISARITSQIQEPEKACSNTATPSPCPLARPSFKSTTLAQQIVFDTKCLQEWMTGFIVESWSQSRFALPTFRPGR